MQIERYIDSILDVLSDGIYISDQNGITLKVNRAYEQLSGLRREELLGKCVTDLQKEGAFDVVLNPDIVKTRRPQTSVQITRQGAKVVLHGYPVFNAAGDVVLVVTFVRDITALSNLEEQLTYQRDLITTYHSALARESGQPALIAKSRAMTKLLDTLYHVATTDATVLLLGETGVGKDSLARKIHETSSRSSQPFFKIDCSAIPENLMESELFGYEAGAFSGANTGGKPGYIEMAHKGTLFLNEVGELPLLMQTRLLRFLQDREFMRVGSTKVRKVDVRIIAATNRDLVRAVKDGQFRSDLYYRLCVAVVTVPPLRERSDDILPLANHFLGRFNAKYRKNLSFSPEAADALQAYEWPGNVRELENLVQSLVVTTRSKDRIEGTDLPPILSLRASGLARRSLHDAVAEFEHDIIRKAFEEYGSISEVARALQVDRVTIYRKLKRSVAGRQI
ncbi:MAG: sigma 54-interacting transcriptional regulator [Nitrospiraceae bacterium]|jgi:PAS domain S-box-containing protein|nr:sigma 54-interacting transcriptional regulator [Nitrospiraceae bacterium]